jgi:hypothetical protein
MARFFRPCAGVLALTIVFAGTYVQAADDVARVQTTLGVLDQWLSGPSTGDKWRKYLMFDELKEQLAAGQAADPAVVGAIIETYQRDAAYLKQPEFVAVRQALEAWHAELSLPKPAELPAAAQAAKAEFTPADPAALEASKAALRKATAELQTYIAAARYRAGWTKYLMLDQLQAQLDSETPDPAVLDAVAFKFASQQKGLENPIYANVGKALADYLPKLLVARDPMPQADYEARLDRLATLLEAFAATPDKATAKTIGQEVAALEARNQAPTLVRAIRRAYAQPNYLVQASERIVAAGIARNVSETTPIREDILGTDVTGTGRTTGKVSVDLVPNPDRAAFDTIFKGSTSSNNTGYNSGATIWSRGRTTFNARKRTYIDADGFGADPATASAQTQTTVTGVNSGRGGLAANRAQQIAWDRVRQGKPAGERESGRRAALRVRQRMDSDAAKRFAEQNASFDKKYRRPMLDRGAYPKVMNFSSTDHDLFISIVQAADDQLGAFNAPPALAEGADVGIRVHESAVENYHALMLGGDTVDNEEFKEQMIGMLGEEEYNRRYPPSENDGPWEITYAETDPVSIRFADGGYSLTIRITRFKGNQVFTQPMNVTVNYKLEPYQTGIKSVRQGDIEIFPPDFQPGGEQTLTPSQVALKRQLLNRFSQMFLEEEVTTGLLLPGAWEKAGRLALSQLVCDGGWLCTGWVQPATPIPETAAATASAEQPASGG